MKNLVVPAAALLLGIAIGATAVPAALDPVKVAPHIYETAFQNERVRVLKRTIRNGETTSLVQQPDRVVIYLNPCAWIEPDEDGGERMRDYKYGTPTWQPADSHGGKAYDVIQECRIIEVELLE